MPYERICGELSLGRLIGPPRMLSGGYTHRMVALTTERERYAVKLLTPEIMARPDALDNYRRAEGFERLLEEAGLPILPALTIGGRKLQCIGGQYLYVFDYFDGRPRYDGDVTAANCARIGRTLAQIHALGRREAEPASVPAPVDWEALARPLLTDEESRGEGLLLHRAAPMLSRVAAAADAAMLALPRVEAVCHNDMDAKNVLWQGNDFRIIDLECLGWADPMQELLDLATSWAGWPMDETKFVAFVRAYRAAGGETPADPALVFDSRRNHLDWLAYNARRALSDDAAERAMGRSQIVETIDKILSDQENRSRVLRWMEEAAR